jgi:hypothetical protein
MKTTTKAFVQSCATYQQAKPNKAKYLGLLSPLLVPKGAWHTISLDSIEGLPTSGKGNCILVIVDKFSKYAHFVPLHHPFTAAMVVQQFLHHVYKLHGMPVTMISDKDRIFTSQLWQELFRLANVKLQMSSAYHPQTDWQTVQVNQCLEIFLHYFVHACPKHWMKCLSLAEFWYNTRYHTSLDRSPFEVLYGHKPRFFGLQTKDSCQVPNLESWMQERELMQQVIKQHLLRAQVRMKSQADKHRSEVSFQVGDKVFLKLQPYVQSSLAPRAHQKLAFKFFDPFTILAKIGSVAYKLALPEDCSIHAIFHVSQLKKMVSPSKIVSASLLDADVAYQVPELILGTQMVHRGDANVTQILVKWSNMSAELATWEDNEALMQQFPFAPAWGQAGAQGRGDVSAPAAAMATRHSTRARKANSKYIGPEWAA